MSWPSYMRCQYTIIAIRSQSKTYPVATNLLPLHPLPSNRQLPPQALETTLSQLNESPVELFLELVLRLRNLPDHSIRTTGIRNLHSLACAHPDVSVLVVVHVDLDRAVQAAGGREGVGRPPAAVPEVLRGVLVGDEQDGDAAVVRGGVDADGRCGEVLGSGLREGFLEGADEVCVGGFEGVLLGS
jgi:hypothetical protein